MRYQSAAELRADLKRLKRDTDSARSAAAFPAAAETTTVTATRPGFFQRKWIAVGAGALVLALLLAAALYLFPRFASREKPIDSIAVLPFVNLNPDPETEYLSDGITESIINNLSQLPGLRVMARSTVFRYKGKDADPQKVGQELHVGAVLTGRLQQRETGPFLMRSEGGPEL